MKFPISPALLAVLVLGTSGCITQSAKQQTLTGRIGYVIHLDPMPNSEESEHPTSLKITLDKPFDGFTEVREIPIRRKSEVTVGNVVLNDGDRIEFSADPALLFYSRDGALRMSDLKGVRILERSNRKDEIPAPNSAARTSGAGQAPWAPPPGFSAPEKK